MTEDDILQYETQLLQVQQQIQILPAGPEKDSLTELELKLKELIDLSRAPPDETVEPNKDPFDAEYDLFREAVGLKEDEEGQTDEVEQMLESLSGTKCVAPFKHSWSEKVEYHNALIYKVENYGNIANIHDILLRVMFTNPTHKELKPCPFYLDGECKFTEEKCRFSHGEVVLFTSLRDYKEPEFSTLREGSHVLIKQDDGLWHRAIVLSISGENCCVKLELNSKVEESHLQNILPLDAHTDVTDSEDDIEEVHEEDDASDVVRRIFEAPPVSALGSWEKHTNGVGSRIMEKMGYIHGSGLGRENQGRVEPVPAVVYPTGKSLDHCLMLKERAGGDKDLFKAERKMRREQHRHEKALNRAYEMEKQRTDVFTFLNDRLNQNEAPDTCPGPSKGKELRKESQRGLNVSGFQLAEDVRKMEKEIASLNKSLSRHASGSPAFATIKGKLQGCELRLEQLQASARNVSTELKQRKERKSLALF